MLSKLLNSHRTMSCRSRFTNSSTYEELNHTKDTHGHSMSLSGFQQSRISHAALISKLPLLLSLSFLINQLDAQQPVAVEKTGTGQSLRQLIDGHFANDLPKTTVASDAEFIRRVSIDLTAMPPSAEQTQAFIADPSANKREKLVDRLLDSPQFDRQLTNTLDLFLMERRPFKDIKEPEWTQYLLESVRENKPWNQLAREILSATGEEEKTRAAVRFALSRDAEPNLLTRDIGRVFFGRDLQCAQCHDHPLVADYLQSDYQGMLAFVAPGFVKTIKRPGPVGKDGKPGKEITIKVFAEKAGNDINFESVFIKDTKHRTGPRIIGGTAILEPESLPATTDSQTPQFSRRKKMAELATDGTNREFNENIANRLWAFLFGKGLVDPPDFHHRDNPALKPELMRQLGERMVAMDFDMKKFIRELALTNVYQRSFDFPTASIDPAQLEKRLVELQKQRDTIQKQQDAITEKYESATKEWEAAESKHIPVSIDIEKLRKDYVANLTSQTKIETELKKVTAQAAPLQAAKSALSTSQTSIAQAAKQLGKDPELAALVKRVSAKTAALEKQIQPINAKISKSNSQIKAAKEKQATTETTLKQKQAARKPVRAELDKAESIARAQRSELEVLVSKKGAIESEIATYERIKELLIISAKLTGAADPEKKDLLQSQNRILDSITRRYSMNLTIAPLKPLTPEQFCYSVLKTTGVYDRYLKSEIGKIRKEKKLPAEKELDKELLAQAEERTYKILKGHLNNFIRYYAAGAGQPQGDFFATADQALFAANGGSLNSYVNPVSGNITDRLAKATDPNAAANDLYLSILSRLPNENEQEMVAKYFADTAKPKTELAKELVWSLLNSAEFRFNH